ncbi:MAG: calcium-binding protein [Candidatus Methylopumilus sp.]|jgi:Ca2+-binding RTX toxin-like protein
MATKIFNATETEYTGTSSSDFIVGNNLGNYIDGGAGNDIIFGGSGDDLLLGGEGNDLISGGGGNDSIDLSSGNNIADGGSGDDYISAGNGNDIISGGDGNDVIIASGGDDILTGGAGSDFISGGASTAGNETIDGNVFLATSDDILLGDAGNDTFVIGDEESAVGVIIQAGVSGLDNEGEVARYTDKVEAEEGNEDAGFLVYDNLTGQYVELDDDIAEETQTDVRLNLVTRPGSTAISTFASTIEGYNAVDTLLFTQSGEFEELSFSGIERIELASGVNITLSAEQLEVNGESLSLGEINPGLHIYGVAGGPAETVTVELEYEEATFEPSDTIVGATPVTYDAAALEFDDYSVANLFHNVDMIYDASEGVAGSYTRIDGANESAGASETVHGSEGVDNATMRLGDDTYYGNGGNDLLVGHGGADHLDGGEGDDIFLIGGFGSGVQGTTSKADDGNKEWIATGVKHDVIVGGDGVDTLRVTTGIGANNTTNGTVVLNDANFQGMEVVQVGGTVGRLNVEDSALQLLNDHYYFRANGSVADLSNTLGNNGGTINNVVIDASGVTANGLLFEGNANTQTFIGTTQDDRFVGNSGNDTLTGGSGSDTFVFGKVHEQVVTGSATTVQTYVDTAFNLTGFDTITDFLHGTDKLELNTDQYSALAGFTAANFVVGAGATAGDIDDYLIFDTTSHTLKYDADGSGAGAAVNIAVLTGVSTLTTADIVVV